MVAALREGYSVRTTLRSLKRADEVRQMMKAGGIDDTAVQGVEFCVADLTSDDGWQEACKDCKYVLHVASPFPAKAPKDPNELIKPAKEGTLRALRAAKAAGTVKRVVVTSSFAAIGRYSSRENPRLNLLMWFPQATDTQIEQNHSQKKTGQT
jgi:nucleoside-diphosphate-sugar epimerase